MSSADLLQDATLSISIGTTGTLALPMDPPTTSEFTFSRDGDALVAVGFPAGLFKVVGNVIPVTDPGAFPIAGIQGTASNAVAAFDNTGASFGGSMALNGVNKVCLFGPCSAAVSNLVVPLSKVGVGGTTYVQGAVNLTVVGAPWTTASAMITVPTAMGGQDVQVRSGGIVTGPTAMGGLGNTVNLVTPVRVYTNIGASPIVAVWGELEFSVVPEPGAIAGLGAAIAALTAMGLVRRKH